MKFSTREDIEAPIDFVFIKVTDFVGYERSALRRGADVKRLDTAAKVGIGAKWAVQFTFRGKPRSVQAEISSYEAPNGFSVDATSPSIDGVTEIELVPLSRNRTRVSVTLELKPKTLSARLLVQSLKLAKSNLTTRFKTRVSVFAEDIEESFRKQA